MLSLATTDDDEVNVVVVVDDVDGDDVVVVIDLEFATADDLLLLPRTTSMTIQYDDSFDFEGEKEATCKHRERSMDIRI